MARKKPSFVKKILDDNQKKIELVRSKLRGERYGYMGDPSLHWGNGGYVRGHMNLMVGPSKSGKSTLVRRYAAAEQKRTGGFVIIYDSEYSLTDPEETDINGNLSDGAKKTLETFAKLGLDPELTILKRTNIASELFNDFKAMEEDLKKDPSCVAAIIVDAYGSIQSEQARDKLLAGKADDAGKSFGGNAKTLNPLLMQLLRVAGEYAVTVFGVQHVGMNMEQYGSKYVILGGQKMIYLHDTITFVDASEFNKNALLVGDEQGSSSIETADKVGKLVRFKIEKSRAIIEGRTGEFFFNFKTMQFAKPELSLFNLAVRLGVIVHPVSDEGKENVRWWQYPAEAPTPSKWNGQEQVIKAIEADTDLYNEIWQECLESSNFHATVGMQETSLAVQNDDGSISSLEEVVAEQKKAASD